MSAVSMRPSRRSRVEGEIVVLACLVLAAPVLLVVCLFAGAAATAATVGAGVLRRATR